jgi:hypothetical protein
MKKVLIASTLAAILCGELPRPAAAADVPGAGATPKGPPAAE